MLIAAGGAAGAETSSFADAVTAGEANAVLRYRFEHVDQEAFTEEANGSTLRLRLNVTNVNRIFGDTVSDGDHGMNTHLLNARIAVNEHLSATPYGYYIDNDDNPASSTSTIGVRVAANYPLGQDTLDFWWRCRGKRTRQMHRSTSTPATCIWKRNGRVRAACRWASASNRWAATTRGRARRSGHRSRHCMHSRAGRTSSW